LFKNFVVLPRCPLLPKDENHLNVIPEKSEEEKKRK